MSRVFSGSNRLSYASAVVSKPFTFAAIAKIASGTAGTIVNMTSKTQSANNNEGVLSLSNSGGNSSTQSKLGGTIGTANGPGGGVSYDVWYGVAATHSSTTSRYAFLNGVIGSQNTTSVTPASLAETTIGQLYFDLTNIYSAGLNGQICEVAAWSAILTDPEIVALSKGFSPRIIRPASLVAYWPLGGHYGRLDKDFWKSKLDMSPTGSPTWGEHTPVIYPLVG